MLPKATKLLLINSLQKIRPIQSYRHVAQFTKVEQVLEKWKEKFKRENITEPLESIQHILAFNLGIKNVSTDSVCCFCCSTCNKFFNVNRVKLAT